MSENNKQQNRMSETPTNGPFITRIRDWIFSEAGRPVRFACVGGVAGLTQLGILSLLLTYHWNATLGNLTAFLLAAQLNFVLSSLFTWKDRQQTSQQNNSLLTRWLTFHSSIASTAVLNNLTFAIAHTVIPSLAASALGIVVAALANFFLMNYLVFRVPPPLSPPSVSNSSRPQPETNEKSPFPASTFEMLELDQKKTEVLL